MPMIKMRADWVFDVWLVSHDGNFSFYPQTIEEANELPGPFF
jgi:hypothetical protein